LTGPGDHRQPCEWEGEYVGEIILAAGDRIVCQADSLKELGWEMHVAIGEYESEIAKGIRS